MPKQSFWSDGSLEPKRSFRFLLFMGGVPQWIVKSTNRPQVDFAETTHAYLNHTFKYLGRATWSDLTVTIVDPVSPDASKTLERIIREAGYDFPQDANDLTTISKAKATAALGLVALEMIGAEGETIERWELQNAQVKSINWGSLDYSEDDEMEIEMTLMYDFARMVLPFDEAGVAPANS